MRKGVILTRPGPLGVGLVLQGIGTPGWVVDAEVRGGLMNRREDDGNNECEHYCDGDVNCVEGLIE